MVTKSEIRSAENLCPIRDPWDSVSPPTSEIMGTKCIWSPPTFATGFHFSLGSCRKVTVLPQTSWLNLRGEGKKDADGNGWNVGGRRERGQRRKRKRIGIHPTWGLLQLSSGGCAHVVGRIIAVHCSRAFAVYPLRCRSNGTEFSYGFLSNNGIMGTVSSQRQYGYGIKVTQLQWRRQRGGEWEASPFGGTES